MKKQNKSMISMMHRLVNYCGKYKTSIRASYLPGIVKGFLIKSPLVVTFFMACDFMAARMTKEKCLIFGIIILGCVVLQAVLQNVTDRLQSATGFKVFADKRMEMGDHFRKLSMGYFTEGNIGKVSSVLATDMNFIEENCMMVLEELVGLMISQGLMIVFMFWLNWRLGFASLVGLVLIMLFGNITTRKSISHSMLKQKTSEKMTGSILEFAEGIGIIKTFNMLGEKSKELNKSFEESCDNSIKFETAYAPWWASII
ncbi:MAG: ABC transporter ATP-binding protein, partial [Treponema sp.]|nr:ABC transporter ATP-binding protein [Treponema sp.]